MPTRSDRAARTYRILGIPLRTGSLYPGSEDDARAYRDARLVARMADAGCAAVDEGDLDLPSYLPHHSVPPIRNWPGPRVAWDAIGDRLAPVLREPGHVPLLIGCDCSIVVGTLQALRRASTGDAHVLYVDGDFDDAPPEAGRCQSAAALAVWLATHASPFWAGPPLEPAHLTVIGWSVPSRAERPGVRSLSLADVRRSGAAEAARRALEPIAPDASILVHLDIDVFREADVPAAYFPHADGLALAEGRELLRGLLGDPRVRLIEISEYASLRDPDRRWAAALADVLAGALGR